MTLAIFDLDHTLITGDSDTLWGEYMVENGIVGKQEFSAGSKIYNQDYQRGTLDNDQCLEFALKPLTQYP
jgi:phosphoserine phosphatase